MLTFFKTKKFSVIAKKILREFWKKHTGCEQQLKAWFKEAAKAEWRNLNEIKTEYPSASIIGNDRIVFNIKGNSYRLIVKINFDYLLRPGSCLTNHILLCCVFSYRNKKDRFAAVMNVELTLKRYTSLYTLLPPRPVTDQPGKKEFENRSTGGYYTALNFYQYNKFCTNPL